MLSRGQRLNIVQSAEITRPEAKDYFFYDESYLFTPHPVYPKLPFGAIIGTIEIVDCCPTEEL